MKTFFNTISAVGLFTCIGFAGTTQETAFGFGTLMGVIISLGIFALGLFLSKNCSRIRYALYIYSKARRNKKRKALAKKLTKLSQPVAKNRVCRNSAVL